MRALMTTLILLLAGANVACASHGYDRSGWRDHSHYGAEYRNLVRAASRLEHEAGEFYSDLRRRRASSRATHDAKKLARAAEHFRREVERARDERHLRKDYDALASAFVEAGRELAWSRGSHHDRFARAGFRRVERAFADLERSVRRPSGRYPGEWRHDRYGAVE